MYPESGDLIEEERALLEALKIPDDQLVAEGVTDPHERYQIVYLALLLSMVGEPPVFKRP